MLFLCKFTDYALNLEIAENNIYNKDKICLSKILISETEIFLPLISPLIITLLSSKSTVIGKSGVKASIIVPTNEGSIAATVIATAHTTLKSFKSCSESIKKSTSSCDHHDDGRSRSIG